MDWKGANLRYFASNYYLRQRFGQRVQKVSVGAGFTCPNVDGTVDKDLTEEQIKAGDLGTSITRLAPMGKIKINSLVREAKSVEGYIDEHNEVEVVSVEGTRILVKNQKK